MPPNAQHPTPNTQPAPRFFYGWYIVGATLIALMIGSGLTFWSFTVYIPPLEDEFGWSRAQVASAFSVGVIVSGIASPFVGRIIDRIGARRSIAIGSLGLFVTFLLFGRVQSLWQYLALYGLQAFISVWTLFLPFQWLLAQWFWRRRGLALGIATAGFGLGGSFILPLIAFFIDQWGWRTAYLLSGVIVLVAFLPVSLLLVRDRPADLGLQPDGDPEPPPGAPSPRAEERTWSFGELRRSRQFWLLALVQMFFFGSLVSFGLHSIPFFESIGRTATYGATLVSISALVRTPARIFAGWALDKLPSLVWVATGIALLHAACLALLVVADGAVALWAFVVLWGIGGGFGPMLGPIVVARTFGTASFATVSGALLAVETVATVTLPPLGGYLFDRSGNYDAAFLIYAAGFALAAVAWYVFYLNPTPAPAAREPSPALSDA